MIDKIPFDNPRKQQTEALEFLKNSKAKFSILEMPTGSGKSGVAIAAGMHYGDTYVLTSQKVLQDQYIKDFGSLKDFAVIKGAKNYNCSLTDANKKIAPCIANPGLKKICDRMRRCDYIEALKKLLMSKVGLANYSYFFYINGTGCKPTLFQRNCLILDEAHNLEKEIINYITISLEISELDRCGVKLNVFPEFENIADYQNWSKKVLYPSMLSAREILKSKIDKILRKYVDFDLDEMTEEQTLALEKIAFEAIDEYELTQLREKFEVVDKQSVKVEKFFGRYKDEAWIFNKEEGYLEFKPATVRKIASDVLFDFGLEKVIFLSATIVNSEHFAKSLGIEKDFDFLSIGSDFPKENREVNFKKVGLMSYKHIDNTLPKMTKEIQKILEKHKGEKGIIHSGTYKVSKFIENNLKDGRLISHGAGDGGLAFQKHKFNIHDSVLLSPTLFEGVDLVDDLSRFQIICKLPWPFLGDKLIAKRCEVDDKYMETEMIRKFIQTCGRSIRHKEDFCKTYVLDSSAEFFLKKNKDIIPKYFYESLIFNN